MSMILYLGDRELFDFIFNINQDISSELSVSEADKIIVMDGGKIKGFGTHEELLKNNEIYKEVYESQMKGSDNNE